MGALYINDTCITKLKGNVNLMHTIGDLMSLSLVEIGSIITNIATIIGLIIAFAKLHLDQQKSKEEIELSKQYLKSLSQLVESHVKSQESQQQIEKDRLNWQKLKDAGKALWELATYEEE